MRTIAIILGLAALAALPPLAASIVRVSGSAAHGRRVSKPLTVAAVFTVVLLVAICGASVIAPTGG